jgi:hypothetical protein
MRDVTKKKAGWKRFGADPHRREPAADDAPDDAPEVQRFVDPPSGNNTEPA